MGLCSSAESEEKKKLVNSIYEQLRPLEFVPEPNPEKRR